MPLDELTDLGRAGFRILPCTASAPVALWHDDRLPSWTEPLLWSPGRSLRGAKYLLTFCPFGSLPPIIRKAYLAGELHLLPFPGSLVFWGALPYLQLAEKLPLAAQIPLLHSVERHAAPRGIRVPQSGWLHEPRPGGRKPSGDHGPIRNTYRRTHRWARVHRDDDELAVSAQEDRVAHVLFSTAADDLGLYGKPMARNAQIWTHDFQRLLDGPTAGHRELVAAARALAEGGLFGYRFLFPAMRVGLHEVFWQRPLVAYHSERHGPTVLPDAPLGYLTAYAATRPKLERPIELWPRLMGCDVARANVRLADDKRNPNAHRAAMNVRKLIHTRDLLGEPLDPTFARSLLTVAKQETLDDWLDSLSIGGVKTADTKLVVSELRSSLAEPSPDGKKPTSLTFAKTGQRSFEKEYWNTIAELSTGQYINKVNSDCVRDEITQARLKHHHRDLEALGDYLLAYYHRAIDAAGQTGKVVAGELPFTWRTEFDYGWQGGWVQNQSSETYERDLIVVIPGRDRSRAVIMADHYDTAYMEDQYGYGHGGHGPRLAAAGADDNHSATAALMLGADLHGAEPKGQARLRHLARPPDRRGVSGRLSRRSPPVPVPGGADARAAHPRHEEDEGPFGRPRARGLCARHGGTQQRSRSRRVSDVPGDEPRVDVAGVSGPRGQSQLERVGAHLERKAAAAWTWARQAERRPSRDAGGRRASASIW